MLLLILNTVFIGEAIDHHKDCMMSIPISKKEEMEKTMDVVDHEVEHPQEISSSTNDEASESTYHRKGTMKLACPTTQVEKYDKILRENYLLFDHLVVYEYVCNDINNRASMQKNKHS